MVSIPFHVVGDVDVQSDDFHDAHDIKFHNIVAMLDLEQSVNSPTRRAGNLLAVVITAKDKTLTDLVVCDVGLYDFSLITWSINTSSFTASLCDVLK